MSNPKNPTESVQDEGFGAANLYFGAGAAATIGAGFLLLSQGSIVLAPILLVVGYVILVPLAFLY